MERLYICSDSYKKEMKEIAKKEEFFFEIMTDSEGPLLSIVDNFYIPVEKTNEYREPKFEKIFTFEKSKIYLTVYHDLPHEFGIELCKTVTYLKNLKILDDKNSLAGLIFIFDESDGTMSLKSINRRPDKYYFSEFSQPDFNVTYDITLVKNSGEVTHLWKETWEAE